jgi:hypothetical protein
VVTAVGAVVRGQHSADHIFVEVEAKGLGQVLGDLRAAKSGIAPLEFTDGSDQFRRRPFWTGVTGKNLIRVENTGLLRYFPESSAA